MYRVVKMSGVFYALEIKEVEDDIENITDLVASGDVVILCDDLQELEGYGIDAENVVVVK